MSENEFDETSSVKAKDATLNEEGKMVLQLQTLCDDVDDFIDENVVGDISDCLADLDVAIKRMEEYRSIYRSKQKTLVALYGDMYSGSNAEYRMRKMKDYILECKDARRSIINYTDKDKEKERSREMKQKGETFRFISDNTRRLISDLEAELSVDVSSLEEADLLERNKALADIEMRMRNIEDKIRELLFYSSDANEPEITDFKRRYGSLQNAKNQYVLQMKKIIKDKEIEKEDLFKEGKLNIKLPKFKGYGSHIDIYSFQSKFNKMHERTIPKRLMSEVLKNNFLEDSPLSLVKDLDDIEEIWSRLKKAFGDPKVMMNKKMDTINKIGLIWKIRDSEKLIDALQKVVNIMNDLTKLSNEHGVMNDLYHGDVLERIFKQLGDRRLTNWISETCDKHLSREESWKSAVKFLEKEISILQQKRIFSGKEETKDDRPAKTAFVQNTSDSRENFDKLCPICGEAGHVDSMGPNHTKVIQYFTCKKFVDMTPAERFNTVKSKGYCYQCLFPGAKWNEGKHKDGSCQHDFACKHPSHAKFRRKKHILLCEEHKGDKQNLELLESYKTRFILKDRFRFPDYSKGITLSLHTGNLESQRTLVHTNQVTEKAIYQLQIIKVGDQNFSVFYDSGCGDFVSRYSAIKRLGSKAIQECPGPIQLGGVGGIVTESPHGIYKVKLPLSDGTEVLMSGVCLDYITAAFPRYPIQGKVEKDIHEAYADEGGNPKHLPKLPKFVGGEIDFMIGIKYLRYHPEKIFQLPSGLAIYRSYFTNADGGRGIIGGPHQIFSAIERQFYLDSDHQKTFLCNQDQLFRMGYQVNPDLSLLGYKATQPAVEHPERVYSLESRAIRRFEDAENAGSEVAFRCVKCRTCKECKNAEHNEARSIREEVEEDLIAKSVTIDLPGRQSIAKLPLLYDPTTRLMPNKYQAIKVYYQQVKKLNQNIEDKQEVLASERKLQEAGYVDYVRNLPEEQQKKLNENEIQNYIPWRCVWKESSISTPCRVVFDASQITGSGYSLNNILAKGRNNMNILQEIFIRWSTHAVALHTDVQKMYNCVKLKEDHWCLQRYLWSEGLDTSGIPEEKVIKTLIYGVVSSGNLAERCIRSTAKLSEADYPEVSEIVHKDLYVDDCLSGEKDISSAKRRADELELVLNKGGFSLKGVAFSYESPPESLSEDGEVIVVAGHKWYTKEDKISLNLGDLTFVKKKRGKVQKDGINRTNVIPDKLTRRHCVSKVAEIFDLTGKFTPITCGMKMDLHELVQRKLQWDDVLPDNLRAIWTSHFEMIQEMKSIKYRRAVIPPDAVSLDVDTIAFGDASRLMLCAAIYVRFRRKSGGYSCQLLLARSKLIPDGMSQPRAELYAALVNTHSNKIVEKALYKHHKNKMMLTDSQIVLYWISNDEKPLKQWVRNRVIEIRRYTEPPDWYFIDTKNMIADMGTRKGCTLNDIDQDSTWINGYEWMKLERELFPIKPVEDIALCKDDLTKVNAEVPFAIEKQILYCDKEHASSMLQKMRERYQYSRYLIDPNKRTFTMVVRILATVIRFIKILRRKVKKADGNEVVAVSQSNILHDDDIKEAEDYFFKKGSEEVKKFCKKSQYEKFTKENGDILMYTGRILPVDHVEVVTSMTNVMKDLTATSFCVPVLDKYSPISYSIVNDYHWNNKVVKHCGIETTLRYIMKYVYIIEGRDLVKTVKKSCQRCRYISKKTIDISMGPVSRHNITIAPAFYISQVDLAGPFKSYSCINKRATIKIWLVIFCCATTTTTCIKAMDDYSSSSFLQSFTRFSCDVGYPKVLLVDSGSQILSSCENMKLTYQDIKFRLHRDVNIEFEVVPVGGHNMNGKVERKIREIRKSLEINVHNERISLLQWETLASEIANRINDLPLALGGITADFESMDLITPNRLRIGRNNDRSPCDSLTITNDSSRIMEENKRIFSTWFEHWLISHVPKLMKQPKWFKDEDINIGDVVLFLKHDSTLSTTYQYGIVQEVEKSKDGIVRKVKVRYRNHNENIDRITFRSVRQLVMIHPASEINLAQELDEIAKILNKYECVTYDTI